MKLTRCRFEFKKEDAWVGIFWKTTHAMTDRGEEPMFTDAWICLVPCVPLHLTFFHDIAIPFRPEVSTDDHAAA
jgi:hypothetical protein